MSEKTFFIGIAGGSGSGKTTFVNKIRKRVPEDGLTILHQDSYYHKNLPTHLVENGVRNFDHPDAFDWDLLFKHIRDLQAGESVEVPVYDYNQSSRSLESTTLGPSRVVLFEGIYALLNERIRELLDLKVYLNVDADIRFIRRLHRDVKERSRTVDSIIKRYYDTVRPMHREYLEPTRQYADMIIGEETDIAADVIAAHVKQLLNHHQMIE